MTARRKGYILLVSFLGAALLGAGGWYVVRSFSRSTPSVLLITLDTTRADRFGCYGSKRSLTPRTDAFARDAAVFELCDSAVPETMPSHTTIMSGWDPPRHGIRENLDVRVGPKVPLLAEEFKKDGYATAAFISSFVLLKEYGIGRGFQVYNQSFYDPRHPDVVERTSDKTVDAAIPWLLKQKGRWFCWVHLYDPHFPYTPPPPYAAKYAHDPYDGEIAFMDHEMGRMLSTLAKAGKLDNTLVVICGDHGESLGDHGEETHKLFIYQATMHVPLLIRLPGQQKGRRIAAPVGLVDVAPTIREICGLAPVPTDGQSLLPALTGQSWTPRPVYLESMNGLYNFGWAPLYGLVEGRFKYILAPKPELYDVVSDPGEHHNLVQQDPQRASMMKKALQTEISTFVETHEKAIHLDNAELKSLESLGYIGGAVGKSGKGYRDPKDMVGMLSDYTKAVTLLQRGEEKAAAPIFDKLVKEDSSNPVLYYYLANCYEKVDLHRAEGYYKKAIQFNPSFQQAYERLIQLWVEQGKSKQAFQLGHLALEHVEDVRGRIHVLMAWALYRSGAESAQVRTYLDKASALAPESGLSYKLRALLALKSGNKDAAIKMLEKMSKVAPPVEIAMLGREKQFEPLGEDERFWLLVLTARREASKARSAR
ncbi:MAG: sulfatase-like hydrolase/transferase [Acidobacteriota bacterium]